MSHHTTMPHFELGRGINEKGRNLFDPPGIVVRTLLLCSSLSEARVLDRLCRHFLDARTRTATSSYRVRCGWVFVRGGAATERSSCKSHCK